MIAAHGVSQDVRTPAVILNSVRSAVANVLQSLPAKFVEPADDTLPLPSLGLIRSEDHPARSGEDFAHSVRSEQNRRRRLRGLLNAHGWGVDEI